MREMAQGILPLDKRDVAGEQQKKRRQIKTSHSQKGKQK